MASDRIWGNRDEKTVILDSSALMMLFEFQVDLEDELTRLVGKYHIIIPKPIYDELEFLSKHGRGKKRINAKASLKLVNRYNVVDVEEKTGDDSVFSLARQTKGIVVTNDKELKNRLKKISVSVIFLRAKKKLVME